MKMRNVFASLLVAFLMTATSANAEVMLNRQNVWNATQTFKHGFNAEGDITLYNQPIGGKTFVNEWYVNATGGSNTKGNNYGKSKTKPFASVDYAINQCSANDIIYVLPGHSESFTAADGFDADVAGISIIGIGTGTDMPEFTFADTDATVAIGAANVTLCNLRFLAGISEVVTGISVEAVGDNSIIENCFFPEPTTSTWEFDKAIVLASGADRVRIRNNTSYRADATGATSFIDIVAGVVNGCEITGNYIHGEYSNAPIYSDQINLEMLVANNFVQNMTTGQFGIEFSAAATGSYGDNWVYTDGATTAIDPGSMKAIGPNWIVTAIDKSPVMFPAQDDTAENLLGVNNADNAAATTSVAANEDGSILERLEQIQEAVNTGSGTSMASNKSIADALGTDGTTPVDAATSVLGAIGVNDADNAMDTSTVVANANGSVLERDEALQVAASPSKSHPNYFTVTADMTSATWNTAAAHEIATVTGACQVRIMVETTATIVTTGTNGTIALGFEGNASAIFSATALDAAVTGDVFSAVYGSAATSPASGADAQSALTHALFDVVVATGKDIGYTIATNAATTGTLTFHVWWTPLDSTGAVAAGAGGVL